MISMEQFAIRSMKDMNKKDCLMCSKLVMKEQLKNGYVSEELCRAIIDFGMKKDNLKINIRLLMERLFN